MIPVKLHLYTCHFLHITWLDWETLDEAQRKKISESRLNSSIRYTGNTHRRVHWRAHTHIVKHTHEHTRDWILSQTSSNIFPLLLLLLGRVSLNVLISVHTYFGAQSGVRDSPFFSSSPRCQSNSAWYASLWVTGDADAHFISLVAKLCGQEGSRTACWIYLTRQGHAKQWWEISRTWQHRAASITQRRNMHTVIVPPVEFHVVSGWGCIYSQPHQ